VPSPDRIRLLLATFMAGLVSLALELAAGRLLAPAFGTTELVWTAVIGMILLYMAVGYAVGGRIADRAPRPALMDTLLALAGLATAVIPLVARPLLALATRGMVTYRLGLVGGTLVSVLALFSVPVTLLACVSPYAVRLAVVGLADSGRTVGLFSAVAAAGSFIGTVLPTFILIPNLGTRRTFVLLAVLALVTGLLGLWHSCRRRFWLLIWGLPALAGLYLWQPIAIKPLPKAPGAYLSDATLILESESAHNFIQVVEDPRGRRYLLLNEGQGIHSVFTPVAQYADGGDPTALLTGGPWDYYLIAPLFNPAPFGTDQVRNALVIGLAAGTTPTQLTEVYGPLPIDGVEIDGRIVEIGRTHFGMTQPNLTAHITDGRAFLSQSDALYDLVAVDAYRLPYIPWHLTTVEFFAEVHEHLTDTGVVAINVGHTPGPDGDSDWRLVSAMVNTMRQVYPAVHVIAIPGSFNAIVVATGAPSDLEDFTENAAATTDLRLKSLAERASQNLRRPEPSSIVFTDDLAPVEQMTHALALRYMLGMP